MNKSNVCEMVEEKGDGMKDVTIQYQAGEINKSTDSVGMKAILTEQELNQLRRTFIRKMYTIISLQFVTVFLVCRISFFSTVQEFIFSHIVIFWTAVGIICLIVIPSLIFKSFTRTYPYNFIFLSLLFLCQAYAIASCCSVYKPQQVLYAIGLAALLVITLAIYSCRESEMSIAKGILICFIFSLALLGVSVFLNPLLSSVLFTLGAFGFSFYLLIYTKLINKKFGEDYDSDDYIIASLCVYLDVVPVFLYVMEMLSKKISR